MFSVAPSWAQSGEWYKNSELKTRLIAAPEKAQSVIEGGLEIDLSDGWHTYWRISGDSGLPPIFSWAESKNIENVDISFPAPTRKKEQIFYTFGYDDAVTFPLLITRKDPNKSAKLVLNAQIMICSDICIPQRLELDVDVDKDGDFTQHMEIITAAKAKIPQKQNADQENMPQLSIDSIVAGKDSVVLSVTSQNGFDGIDAFPVIEEHSMGLTLPPEIQISEHDPTKAMLKIAKGIEEENLAAYLQNKTLSVTVVHGDIAVEKIVQY